MIFFDLDDTLFDNRGAEWAAAIEFHQAQAGLFPESPEEFAFNWHEVTEKHYRRYVSGELTFQGQRRERLREIFARHRVLSDIEADELVAWYFELYARNWTLFSDVTPCLDHLAENRLGIITNGTSRQQRQKLAATGILERFEVVAVSEEIGITKPDPRIFLEACRLAKADPGECWHIGDNLEADVEGSLAAGMRGVWLNRLGSLGRDGVATIGSLGELAGLLGW
jgi:putative hydrolase of the HAD superfamily